jgi:hypothetical protein
MAHKLLFCKGSYYDMGLNQGESLGYEIRQNLIAFWEVLKTLGYDKNEVLEQGIKSESLYEQSRVGEIAGIADGARIGYPEMLTYNIFHDVAFPEECTVMMAVGSTGATGDTVFMKNSDKVGSDTYTGENTYKNKEVNVVVVLEPEDGNKVIGVAAAGVTAIKMGLSDRGVAAGTNISRTVELAKRGVEKDSIKIKALDRAALIRDGLIKGNNALEAAQIVMPGLLENPMSTPGNMEFADAREGVIIEGSYKELAMEIVRDDIAARSNRFVLLKELARDDDLSSICRYIRCHQLLEEIKGEVTMDKMIEFSMDHVNGPGPNSICRHGTHFSEETSLSAAVMEINGREPEKSRIAIALGKPCHAWKDKEAHIICDMTIGPKDLAEGLRNGEAWKKFYTEEPNIRD